MDDRMPKSTPDPLPWDRSTSRSLLAHAQQDDAAAWTRLVNLYAPLVASWCRRWGVAEQDLVDLLQDVFAAVAKNLAHFRKQRAGDTFRGWLLTITRNKVRDHYRRRSTQPAAVGGTEASLRMAQLLDPDSEPTTETVEADPAFSDVLHRALESIRGEFHEHTWRAFWGVAVEGRAAADVARDLAMQPGAVRVAKSRVLFRLRRELGDVLK
jgi:RNA polymerase sigma-70 factor (ECF subfamily)